MLEHLHAGDDVECTRTFLGQCLRADLAELVEALSSSRLVSVERATGATQSIAQQSSGSLVASLSGGSSSSATLAEWTSALATIESADIQIIVAWSDLATVHAEIKKHLRLAALAGRERNAWVGSARNETLSQLNVRAKALNDRNIALVGQHLSLVDQRGRVENADITAALRVHAHEVVELKRRLAEELLGPFPLKHEQGALRSHEDLQCYVRDARQLARVWAA